MKKGGSRVPTSGLHALNACGFLFLLSVYLVVAGAASFDKKELCRSDTCRIFNIQYLSGKVPLQFYKNELSSKNIFFPMNIFLVDEGE